MKTALALRHLHYEDLGTFAPVLQAHGYALRYVDPGVEDLSAIDASQADLLVVLGGPIGAFDEDRYPFLAAELTLVRQRLAARLPTLGICLGAQLMARALGANVASMGVKEIGYAPLALTPEGMASPLAALAGVPVLHWHGDRFEIPEGATRLAATTVCDNQAYALGTHALGLQCHLEADATLIERWLVGHACELDAAGIDPRSVREAARQAQATLPDAARRCLSAWLAALEAA